MLRAEIRGWAGCFDQKRNLLFWSRQRNIKHELSSLTKSPEQWLQAPIPRSALLEAYLWDYLLNSVFQPGFLWSGNMNEGMSAIHKFSLQSVDARADPKALEDYHTWRALTAIQFHESPLQQSLTHALINKLQTDIQERVRTFAAYTSSNVRQELRTIIAHAVDIDLLIQTQQATYQPYRLTEGDRLFDFRALEGQAQVYRYARKTTGDDIVRLVVSPGLYRSGDVDGVGRSPNKVILERCEVWTDSQPRRTDSEGLRRSNATNGSRRPSRV
ncbi:hypothetical protein LTR49_020635 [Elasticomyces elasticus]|nr:hypothetical protein LTR49_020635 [Elasticomyces elasticus]